MKLSEGQLQKIKDAALYKFKNEHNINVAPDLYPLVCYLEAFADHCARLGSPLVLEMPSRLAHEVLDED